MGSVYYHEDRGFRPARLGRWAITRVLAETDEVLVQCEGGVVRFPASQVAYSYTLAG